MSEIKVVLAGVDTLLVNFKFTNEDGLPNGESLPQEVSDQFDAWQKAARKEHTAVPTSLVYRGQTLFMRPHGAGTWSWLLYSDEVKVSLSYGTLKGAVFCQARFASHLLWSVGPEQAIVDLEATLYDLLGRMVYEQASEIHLCADVQGWDVSCIDWQHGFVSRVVRIRDRPEVPTEEEQAGGLSPAGMQHLEAQIAEQKQEGRHDPFLTTVHRRIATLDFGSHGSNLSAQIYNKSVEIKQHRKQWFESLWQANGWDGTSTVWRIEFRFKRKFLAECELNEAFGTLERLEALWKYATEEWLRYVDVTASCDSNKSRLPTHPAWEAIQHAYSIEDIEAETRDAQGECQVRLAALLEEHPMQVLTQAVSLSTLGTPPEVSEQVKAMQECFQDEPPEVQREIAEDLLSLLSASQVHDLVSWLSPQPFYKVQERLIKRTRSMAKRQACIAGGVGYIRSAVALAGDELSSVPGQEPVPDLMASLIWFFGQMYRYDKERGRVHVEEIWKKRLAYGFVTARQMEEECKQHGIDLHEEDWAALDDHLSRLSGKSNKTTRRQSSDTDIA